MLQRFNRFLDWFSNTFAHRKGLLPLIGAAMVITNFILPLLAKGWLVDSDLFLHLGVIVAILGFMIAWAL